MKIFLDTASVTTVRNLWMTGLIDGVTTNPTLIRRSGEDPLKVYDALVEMGVPDISMEVSGDFESMIEQGEYLHETFGPAATIKLPMTKDGLLASQILTDKDIRTNITLVFTIPQAILAAKAGATYVSPFVGRLDDQQVAGLEVVRGISGLFLQKGVQTKIIAASIRTVQRAVRSWYNGADIVTMPPEIFEKMYDHILTDVGLDIFEKDLAAMS